MDYARLSRQSPNTNLNFRAIFPLALFFMVFALAIRQCTLIDPDLWWHLRTGQQIFLARAIPHVDIYSFTKAGSEWVTHEWLSELIIYGLFRVGGWGLIVSVFSATFTLALLLVYRECDGRPYAAGLAVVLAAAASSPFIGVRPQMITFLFSSIFLKILSGYSQNGKSRRLWWLLPLILVWINMHAGFAVGLALILIFMLRLQLDGRGALNKRLAILFVSSLALVPVNPSGSRLLLYPLQTLASPSMAQLIDEWASPNFHDSMFYPFAAMLLLLLAALALSNKKATKGETFTLVILALGALRSARHIPLFCLFAIPILARQVWGVMEDWSWDKPFTKPQTASRGVGLVFLIVFAIVPPGLAAFRLWDFVKNQKSYEAQKYPLGAVEFIRNRHLEGPIFNEYTWGGYLIGSLYPEYRVYIDGRADVYGDDFMLESVATHDGHLGWRESLRHRDIRTVLISPNAALASLLRTDPSWSRVYEDSQAVIFSRSEASALANVRTNLFQH